MPTAASYSSRRVDVQRAGAKASPGCVIAANALVVGLRPFGLSPASTARRRGLFSELRVLLPPCSLPSACSPGFWLALAVHVRSVAQLLRAYG